MRIIARHRTFMHFRILNSQGWPRLVFQVSRLDDYGRLDLAGYGFCHIPTAPGEWSQTQCAIERAHHLYRRSLRFFFYIFPKHTLKFTVYPVALRRHPRNIVSDVAPPGHPQPRIRLVLSGRRGSPALHCPRVRRRVAEVQADDRDGGERGHPSQRDHAAFGEPI